MQERTEVGEQQKFICECKPEFRKVCAGLSFYKEHEGKGYCVLHYPSTDKVDDFEPVLQQMLAAKNYNFGGVFFPSLISFESVTFNGKANFDQATFRGAALFFKATFSRNAGFRGTTFSGNVEFGATTFRETVDFRGATFSRNAEFRGATFSGNGGFKGVTFSGEAEFRRATFNEFAGFDEVTFTERAEFDEATFGEDANFVGAMFRRAAEFRVAVFSGSAGFGGATFSEAAKFWKTAFRGGVDFKGVTFGESASFEETLFDEFAEFERAIFSRTAQFRQTAFTGSVDFGETTFSGKALFKGITFSFVSFRESTFEGLAAFYDLQPKEDQRLDFRFTRFEQPDAVTFHTSHLSPSWFVDADDCRRFRFQNIEWLNLNDKRCRDRELLVLKENDVADPLLSMSRACRNLALNAEENHLYKDASTFRYWAMGFLRMKRKPGRKARIRNWRIEPATIFLDRCYWLASGYGERIGRAFGVLIAIWLLFSGWFMAVKFVPSNSTPHSPPTMSALKPDTTTTKPNLDLGKSLLYSVGVLTFQKPEPKPVGFSTQLPVTLESILGPIQIALLALAIRRKFMR